MKRILFALSLIPTLAFAQSSPPVSPDPAMIKAVRDEIVELETAKTSWRVMAETAQAKVTELEKTVRDKQTEIDTLKQPPAAKKE